VVGEAGLRLNVFRIVRQNYMDHGPVRSYFVKVPASCLLGEYELGTGATLANQFEGLRQRFGTTQPPDLSVLGRENIQARDHEGTFVFTAEPARLS
jgi:hypothetical protein